MIHIVTLIRNTKPRWQQRDVYHTFQDGWTIEWLRTKKDLRLENRLLHGGNACLEEPHWPSWVGKDGGYALLSLRDPEGFPKATILLGASLFVVANRRYQAHPGYTACRSFDDRAHLLGTKHYIMLQVCPKGHPGGDLREQEPETKRIKGWWMIQPSAYENGG